MEKTVALLWVMIEISFSLSDIVDASDLIGRQGSGGGGGGQGATSGTAVQFDIEDFRFRRFLVETRGHIVQLFFPWFSSTTPAKPVQNVTFGPSNDQVASKKRLGPRVSSIQFSQ